MRNGIQAATMWTRVFGDKFCIMTRESGGVRLLADGFDDDGKYITIDLKDICNRGNSSVDLEDYFQRIKVFDTREDAERFLSGYKVDGRVEIPLKRESPWGGYVVTNIGDVGIKLGL